MDKAGFFLLRPAERPDPKGRRRTGKPGGPNKMSETEDGRRLLHPVFGGELKSLDVAGIFADCATACAAWGAKVRQTVDDAPMRFFAVHPHSLPDTGAK